MKRYNFCLNDTLNNELTALSKKKGWPKSIIIREAIQKYIKEEISA